MTTEMRERVIRAIETSNGALTIEYANKIIARKTEEIERWSKRNIFEARYSIAMLKGEIEYFEAVIEVLTETEELEIAKEAIQTVITFVKKMPKIKVMRKVVAIMANKLHKLGYTLSEGFKRAWGFIRNPLCLP